MEFSIDEVKARFIEQKGMEYQAEGMPRIAGKIVGLLIIEDGPFSFSKLAESLQVSRGSISTNTRLLENLGLIERISLPGKRGDYFQLSATPYRSMLEGINARLQRALANATQTRTQLPPELGSVQSRLAELESFYREFLDSSHRLIETLER